MIYHYTIQPWLKYILRDGMIKPAVIGFLPRERAVWFSTNQDWEETARKGSRLTREILSRPEMERQYGIARIGVNADIAPHDWHSYKRLSRVRGANGLYNAAIAWGARPGQWRVTFVPVPCDVWQAVDVFKTGGWVPYSETLHPLEDIPISGGYRQDAA
jgi:hypothetical protein